MTSFLGCCVQLLNILMEVTGVLVRNQCLFSFMKFYVSKGDSRVIAWRVVSMAVKH